MFNPNVPFKWSVDLATGIYYFHLDANPTWDYLYPRIRSYLKNRGLPCNYKKLEDRYIISSDDFDIAVIPIDETIAISFRASFPIGKQILDDAYDNKVIFGLPCFSFFVNDEFLKRVTITFMPRSTWESLNTPEARELEMALNRIDRFAESYDPFDVFN